LQRGGPAIDPRRQPIGIFKQILEQPKSRAALQRIERSQHVDRVEAAEMRAEQRRLTQRPGARTGAAHRAFRRIVLSRQQMDQQPRVVVLLRRDVPDSGRQIERYAVQHGVLARAQGDGVERDHAAAVRRRRDNSAAQPRNRTVSAKKPAIIGIASVERYCTK
jgi:hypothetical protein